MEHKCPADWISYDALLHWILLATTASIIELCTQFPSVCRGVTLDFSDTTESGSVVLSIWLSLGPSSGLASVCCCRGPPAAIGHGALVGGEVLWLRVSDWQRGQFPARLLQSDPQYCSHCSRKRRPTHVLTSSPHFSRKFVSSTYGLAGCKYIRVINKYLAVLSKCTFRKNVTYRKCQKQ